MPTTQEVKLHYIYQDVRQLMGGGYNKTFWTGKDWSLTKGLMFATRKEAESCLSECKSQSARIAECVASF